MNLGRLFSRHSGNILTNTKETSDNNRNRLRAVFSCPKGGTPMLITLALILLARANGFAVPPAAGSSFLAIPNDIMPHKKQHISG